MKWILSYRPVLKEVYEGEDKEEQSNIKAWAYMYLEIQTLLYMLLNCSGVKPSCFLNTEQK